MPYQNQDELMVNAAKRDTAVKALDDYTDKRHELFNLTRRVLDNPPTEEDIININKAIELFKK